MLLLSLERLEKMVKSAECPRAQLYDKQKWVDNVGRPTVQNRLLLY